METKWRLTKRSGAVSTYRDEGSGLELEWDSRAGICRTRKGGRTVEVQTTPRMPLPDYCAYLSRNYGA